MLACWVRKGVNMTTEASPFARLQRNKETAVRWGLYTCVCVCGRVCTYVFESVFSNPGSYCTVVQLEVKQLFYCGSESHTQR